MPNDNVLSGVKCPKCGSEGPFSMQGCAYFVNITDDGTNEYEEFNTALPFTTRCLVCGHEATYGEFQGYVGCTCSRCKAPLEMSGVLLDDQLNPHCPHCGAHLREGDFTRICDLPYAEPCSCEEARWWRKQCAFLRKAITDANWGRGTSGLTERLGKISQVLEHTRGDDDVERDPD